MAKKTQTKKAAPKKSSGSKKPTLKELVALGKELNEIIDIEPPLNLKSKTLAKGIKEVFHAIVPSDEEALSEEAWATLLALGCDPEANLAEADGDDDPDDEAPEAPDDEDDEDADDEDDDEEDDEDDEDDEDADDDEAADEDEDDDGAGGDDDDEDDDLDLSAYVASTRKLDDLKAIVEDYDEFKGLRKGLSKFKGLQGTKDLKAKMQKIVGKPEVKKSTGTKRTGKSARGGGKKGESFEQMAVKMVKDGKSKKQVIAHFIKLYKERGVEDEAYMKKRATIYYNLGKKANT